MEDGAPAPSPISELDVDLLWPKLIPNYVKCPCKNSYSCPTATVAKKDKKEPSEQVSSYKQVRRKDKNVKCKKRGSPKKGGNVLKKSTTEMYSSLVRELTSDDSESSEKEDDSDSEPEVFKNMNLLEHVEVSETTLCLYSFCDASKFNPLHCLSLYI